MNSHVRRTIAAALLCALGSSLAAAPQPLDHFARRPQMQGVSISADGRYVAFLSGAGDETVLMTFDRTQPGSEFKRVTSSEPGKFDLSWCRWANPKRLLCGVSGNIRGKKYADPPFARIFGVDADGSALKVLEQSRNDANLFVQTTSMRNLNMNYGAEIEKSSLSGHALRGGVDFAGSAVAEKYFAGFAAARRDEVVDFTPEDTDGVLIQVDDDHDSFKTIFQLNINNGFRSVRVPENPPIQNFVSDGRGNVRIGWGTSGTGNTMYYARLEGDNEWRSLGAIKAFVDLNSLRPIAMSPEANAAYAIGPSEGRDAFWSIDLTDKLEPQMLFKHAVVDVGDPILLTDQRLLGVRYDVERPYVWYTDPKLRELVDKLEKQYPNRAFDIIDSSADLKILVVQSFSDTDAGTYYTYDTDKNLLQKLGTAYPELDQKSLGKMTGIVYKAADGTDIPGYLTIPTGAARKNLPLIVMPHDGPTQRDSWRFSFLRTFLANRGYAVLQMNYRGSSGFGQKWKYDAHQDWGGITYSDISDATRWAISEGIADPKRICIMGWGFGGYAALLGAARNSDTYRCAVSIAGISDLEMQKEEAVIFGDKDFRRAQIGTDAAKLKRDSPLQNVEQIGIPVLLVHGTKDWQVQVDQTRALSKALDKRKKVQRTVILDGAGHDLERQSDRVTLLKEIEAFLAHTMPP
ncbi:MAG TPA: alpha/beta fold hydrolase [Steroidobacteraceae bacterium]